MNFDIELIKLSLVSVPILLAAGAIVLFIWYAYFFTDESVRQMK